MQVFELKVGHSARITGLRKEVSLYRKRLVSMGLIPGTAFKVIRMAPFGDPIQIMVRGFALSLRKNEASILEIEEIKE